MRKCGHILGVGIFWVLNQLPDSEFVVLTEASSLEIIADDLRAVLRHGLPIAPGIAVDALLRLPGVQARASDPSDRASCVKALDGLLRWQITRFENSKLVEAAPLLFGVTPNTTGTTLSRRRELAASASRYELHHFRKRVEPKIIALLAWQVIRDSEEYARNHAVAPILAPMLGEPIPLPSDVFAWEAVEHEEAISRLWASVYALRAELLSVERLVSMGEADGDFSKVADRALWRVALLLSVGEEYRSAYGDHLLHTDSGIAPSDLVRLAGWIPALGDEAQQMLRECALYHEDRESFFSHLILYVTGPELLVRWRASLIEHLAERSDHITRRNRL